MADQPKRLTRDMDHKMIGGVCAGFAEYLGLDVTLVRVAYVLITIFTAFAGILAYVILWLIIPAKPSTAAQASSTAPPLPPGEQR
jgi:phage shock protein C